MAYKNDVDGDVGPMLSGTVHGGICHIVDIVTNRGEW